MSQVVSCSATGALSRRSAGQASTSSVGRSLDELDVRDDVTVVRAGEDPPMGGDERLMHNAIRGELEGGQLTPRELEVLQLAAEGNIGREIAGRLHVSPSTVRTHFENIYEKLGVTDRAAAATLALRSGIIL